MPTASPVLAHCAGRPNTFLPCRHARWVPVGGHQTCIGIRPRTLGPGHGYPISSTPFAYTFWYVRPWQHLLSWCASHPLSSYTYQRLCRSQSGGGGTAGAISGGFRLVLLWSSPLIADPVVPCVLFLFPGFCPHFFCSTTISSDIHVLACIAGLGGIFGGAVAGSMVPGVPVGPSFGSFCGTPGGDVVGSAATAASAATVATSSAAAAAAAVGVAVAAAGTL